MRTEIRIGHRGAGSRAAYSPAGRWLAGLLLASLVLGACATPEAGFTPLSANRPVAQVPDGLTVSANPAALTQDFGVRIAVATADALAGGQAADTAAAAYAAQPASLTLASPLFSLATQGAAPAQLFVSVVMPSGAEPARYDLYAWDGQSWSFLPSAARGGQRVATVATLPQALALFETAPASPQAWVQIEPGDTLDAGAPADAALLGGVSAQADGALGGVLPNLPAGFGAPLYAVVRGDGVQLAALLADPAARAVHIQTLTGFAVAGGYAGLALDYSNLADTQQSDFTSFVNGLRDQLHAQRKALVVYLDLPASPAAPLGGYDWRTLGAAADALLVRLPADPAALTSGAAETSLVWALGEVTRTRLKLATSALAVSAGADGYTLVEPNAALATLGASQAVDLPETLYAGQPVTLTLSGQGQSLEFDAAVQAPVYRYLADGQTRTVWLTTAAAIRQRLALAERLNLGGVVLTDLYRAGLPGDVADALVSYRTNTTVAEPGQPSLRWTISGEGGVVAQGESQPDETYVFIPEKAGQYQAAAQLQLGRQTNDLGSVPLQVAEVVATPPPTTAGSGNTGGTGGNTGGTGNTNTGGNTGNTGNSGNSGGSGVFVPPPPIAAGIFELGGQVPGFISHPALMQQAGMKWVKFQVRGGGSDLLAAGKAAGFKVMLSAVGDKSRATDPAYWAELASWLGGLAAQGADAIEVWNEPNLEAEWPHGQISGATYTQMLAKVYAAIKAANPSTIVISAAPAPTGAEAAFPGAVMNDDNFLRQMAEAGAANYMDCVGIHFNSGTTSPNATTGSALSGYHYSYYFWPMVDLYYNSFGGSRPLCFTELGYLTSEGYGALPANFSWAANTTVSQQAQWLAESASLAASSGKVRLMIIWNVDFTVYVGDPQAGYAMVRPGGACPACSALDAVMP